MTRALIIILATLSLTGCMSMAKATGNAAAMPFKATYHTGRLTGKGVIGTGKAVGKTGEFVGKSVYNTSKGAYYVGRVPVQITDQALDTSIKVLKVTKLVIDVSGKVVVVSNKIQASELETELTAIRAASDVLSVTIEAF